MRSPFRPEAAPDATILDDHKPLVRALERRGLIRGGLSLGALAMLTGCDVKRPASVQSVGVDGPRGIMCQGSLSR
jgi:hypothetical protein